MDKFVKWHIVWALIYKKKILLSSCNNWDGFHTQFLNNIIDEKYNLEIFIYYILNT